MVTVMKFDLRRVIKIR